jgi:hypothetical protein
LKSRVANSEFLHAIVHAGALYNEAQIRGGTPGFTMFPEFKKLGPGKMTGTLRLIQVVPRSGGNALRPHARFNGKAI